MSTLATSSVLNFGGTSRSEMSHAVQIGHMNSFLAVSAVQQFKKVSYTSTVYWHETHAGDMPGSLLETMKTEV